MPGPFLATKLSAPQLRRSIVQRPDLVQLLVRGMRNPLTLVCAPAGFGKTTLLAEWRESEHGKNVPLAWLSLDRGDNDPSRFWAYFIRGLQSIAPGIGEASGAMFNSLAASTPEPAVEALLEEISDVSEHFAVVLDDYHTIDSSSIHGALQFMLDNPPPQMHLVILSRSDPPLQLPRLRVNRQLTEIRAAQLGFSAEDSTTFLNQVMELELSSEDVHSLQEKTEGWIAGLQLAGLSLIGHEDKSGFIAEFSGSDRYIIDYLVDETLSRQTEEVYDFLCHTSQLSRLSAGLCDAVTGGRESQRILEYLERSNLFLVPLDQERRWYRYHHLFSEVLAFRLQQSRPELLPEIHRQASQWYENEGLTAEAIDHAISAQNHELAARLIQETAEKTLWADDQRVTLLRWIDALPIDLVHSRPELGLFYAWARFTTGRWEGVEPILEAVEAHLGPREDADGLLGEVAAIRAGIAYELGDMERSIDLCQQALELLPDDNLTLRTVNSFNKGLGYFFVGRYTAADLAYRDAMELGRASDNTTIEMLAAGGRVQIAVVRGAFQEAANIFHQSTNPGTDGPGSQLASLGLAHVQMGEVLREWNELESAEETLLKGMELCRQQGGMPEILFEGTMILARVRHAAEDLSGAFEAMQQAENQLSELRSRPGDVSRIIAQSLVYRTRLWLDVGKVEDVADWLDQSGWPDDRPNRLSASLDILRARVLIAHADFDGALELLRQLMDEDRSGDQTTILVENLVLQSVALSGQDHNTEALEPLTRAVGLAEPEGFIRLFMDEGDSMSTLLEQLRASGPPSQYLIRLLQELHGEPKDTRNLTGPMISDGNASDTQITDALNDRELAILRFMAARLSNGEIASELFLSVNTVKWHARNLYAKLGVARRSDAVGRATELKII